MAQVVSGQPPGRSYWTGRSVRRFMYGALIYVAFLVVWELGLRPVYPELTPRAIVIAAVQFLPSGAFLESLWASVRRIMIGFSLASLLGVGFGLVIGLNRVLHDMFEPVWSFLRPISPLAWVPISIVWFGLSERATIVVIVYAAFFPVLLNTVAGVSEAARIYIDAAKTLGANQFRVVTEVVLPSSYPYVLSGLRVALGFSWAVIVAAEIAVGAVLQTGVGYLMQYYSFQGFDLSRVASLVAVIGVMGLIMDTAIRRLGRRIAPWHSLRSEHFGR